MFEFKLLTPEAQKVLTLSLEEASRSRHNFIGTEQILLGLIREGNSSAAKTLASMGINLENTRTEVGKINGHGAGFDSKKVHFTPRATKVLEFARDEAHKAELNIGAEYLLLGIVRNGEGVACRVLENLAADINKIQGQIIRHLAELGGRADSSREPFCAEPPPMFNFEPQNDCNSNT